MLDEFYPISSTMRSSPSGMWQVGMVVKLASHRQAAKNGDRLAESKLCNRIGQLRRNVEWGALSTSLVDEIKASVEFLKTTGREINFASKNPKEWISGRGGAPRW